MEQISTRAEIIIENRLRKTTGLILFRYLTWSDIENPPQLMEIALWEI